MAQHVCRCAPVAQGIERLPPEQKAAGSNPAGGTASNCGNARVADLLPIRYLIPRAMLWPHFGRCSQPRIRTFVHKAPSPTRASRLHEAPLPRSFWRTNVTALGMHARRVRNPLPCESALREVCASRWLNPTIHVRAWRVFRRALLKGCPAMPKSSSGVSVPQRRLIACPAPRAPRSGR